MTEYAFTASISSEFQSKIMDELRFIEEREDVEILFAIESGSRAWGFPSPDSDYDVRFVYVRPMDWYLSIYPGRDVIELPIADDLDINGWDLKKALGLLLKPNPVLLEWLSSPIRYIWNENICQQLIEFSHKTTYGPVCLHHYLHLGQRQWNAYVEGKDRVNLKKYFYIVRPAMVIRWIRLGANNPPPMNFQALLSGINLPSELIHALYDLLDKKSQSKEIGEAKRIPIIDEFISSEFDWAIKENQKGKIARDGLTQEADFLFRNIVLVK